MSIRTTDFDASGASRYFTVSKLGPKRSLTPEGYLLCLDVPVARTGEMLYLEGEIVGEENEKIQGGPDGVIRVSRGPDDLFRPETLASAQGKSVSVSHPDDFIGPDNVRQYEGGVMLNARRGDGIENDLMLADLLIKDRAAIDAVQKEEIEEVSLGYEADYKQSEPGRASQFNILINHVALVERGRCGPRCAIGDEVMPKVKKTSFKDRILAAFKAGDAKEVENLANQVEDEEEETAEEKSAREAEESRKKTDDTLNKVLAKLTSLDERMEKLEAEDEDDDDDDDPTYDAILSAEKAEKLDDAGVKLYTGDAAKQIPALAEILAPGTKLPTFDAKTTDAQRAASLCQCQRKALARAFATDAGRAAITPFLGAGKPNFGKLPYALVNAAFHGAAQAMRAQNNDASRGAHIERRPGTATRDFGKAVSAADINARNREFYKRS